jgi:hypothetical protein
MQPMVTVGQGILWRPSERRPVFENERFPGIAVQTRLPGRNDALPGYEDRFDEPALNLGLPFG